MTIAGMTSRSVNLGDEEWTFEGRSHWVEFALKYREQLLEELSSFEAQRFRHRWIFRSVPCALLVDKLAATLVIGSDYFSQELLLEKTAQEQGDTELAEELNKQFGKRIGSYPMLDEVEFIGPSELLSDERIHQQATAWFNKIDIASRGHRPSLRDRALDFGLDLICKHDELRVHGLKFLAILPSLDFDHSSTHVSKTLVESLEAVLKDRRTLPIALTLAIRCLIYIVAALPSVATAKLARWIIAWSAARFIPGTEVESAAATIEGLHHNDVQVSLDQLGELVVSPEEADYYRNRVMDSIRGLGQIFSRGETNDAGILCAQVSVKASALGHYLSPQDFDLSYEQVAPRLRDILLCAKEHQVFINLDAEHFHLHKLLFRIYAKVLLETPELDGFEHTGIVLQGYLRNSRQHLQKIIELGRERGCCIPIRLVKGAYWDGEVAEHEAHHQKVEHFLDKGSTDVNYRQLMVDILSSHPHVQLVLAGHNMSDHAYGIALRELHFPNTPVIEHQVLHGTADGFAHGLRALNLTIRSYIPVGNLIMGMGYLVRRIMENASQVGVLATARAKGKRSYQVPQSHTVDDLSNYHSGYRPALHAPGDDLEAVEETLNLYSEVKFGKLEEVPIDEIRPRAPLGDWPKFKRSVVFTLVADTLLQRRHELSALIMKEGRKSWAEAQADVEEAVDFVNFYLREQMQLEMSVRSTHYDDVAVIAPWNFPLAIPCGMATAALVAGNRVWLKSAEQTPAVVEAMVQLMYECGLDKDRLVHVVGDAKQGKHLSSSQWIKEIVFTGSKAVGKELYSAARLKDGRESFPRPVIAEMGGKNAIVVCAGADLDEAISGVLYSAFAHAGQKCSACSRVLVAKEIFPKFRKRLRQAVTALPIGREDQPGILVNPLVSEGERQRLLEQLEHVKQEAIQDGGSVIVDRSSEGGEGLIGPVVVEVSDRLARMQGPWACKELFAPVLHLVSFETLECALELVNSTEYGLTLGIYGQSDVDCLWVAERAEVGNIYINRPNTGARVAIEPFGGMKNSGTGPKAGHRDYLRAFQKPVSSPGLADVSITYNQVFEVYRPLKRTSSEELGHKELEQVASELRRKLPSLLNAYTGLSWESLEHFLNWWEQGAFGMLNREHPLYEIPGQKSYEKWSLSKSSVCIVDVASSPPLEMIQFFFCAVISGTGLVVLATNDRAYHFWSELKSAFSGVLAASRLDVYAVGVVSVNQYLRKKGIDTVVFSGSWDADSTGELQSMWNEATQWSHSETGMRDVILASELSHPGRYEWILKRCIHPRSFAMNTIRYGAPLTLPSKD